MKKKEFEDMRTEVSEAVRRFEAAALYEGTRHNAALWLMAEVEARLPPQCRDENIARTFAWEMTGESAELERVIALLLLYPRDE